MASVTQVLPPSAHLLTPSTQSIPLLSASVANVFSNAYTAGVLAYYYMRAGALVSDPLPVLLQDLLPIASLQCLFCIVCLPGAGYWASGTTKPGKIVKSATTQRSGPQGRKVAGTPSKSRAGALSKSDDYGVAGPPLQQRIMPTIFSLILTLAVPPVPLTLLALVLGAPLYPTSTLPHTLAIAVHVSLLALLPVFYTHGVSSAAWRDVAAVWLPFDEAGVWGGAVGCLVGGWVGAIPIALDWDREWQKWPCTVLWGAVLGWSVGRVLTGALKLGIGKRINLSEGIRMADHDGDRRRKDQ